MLMLSIWNSLKSISTCVSIRNHKISSRRQNIPSIFCQYLFHIIIWKFFKKFFDIYFSSYVWGKSISKHQTSCYYIRLSIKCFVQSTVYTMICKISLYVLKFIGMSFLCLQKIWVNGRIGHSVSQRLYISSNISPNLICKCTYIFRIHRSAYGMNNSIIRISGSSSIGRTHRSNFQYFCKFYFFFYDKVC